MSDPLLPLPESPLDKPPLPAPHLMPDETLDEILDGALRCIQPRHGYRFSLDSLLLAMFAWHGPGGSVADLGTGSGIVALLMRRAPGVTDVTGIELSAQLADLACRNLAIDERGAAGAPVRVLHGDLRDPGALERGAFDRVVANPPFYRVGHGRTNPEPQRAAARHELTGTMDDFLAAAVRAAKARAPICVVYPVSRFEELIVALGRHGLALSRLRFVHPSPSAPARQVLVEARKGRSGHVEVEHPVTIHAARRVYAPEVAEFIARLCR